MKAFKMAAIGLACWAGAAWAQTDEDAPTREPLPTPELATPEDDAVSIQMDEASAEKVEKREQRDRDMRGILLTAGAGLEGYTGELAPQINPGPAWGLTVGWRPVTPLSIELSYTGAMNEIDHRLAASDLGIANGADILRNGGQAVATFGLTVTRLQPYLLGGVGFSHYDVRGDAAAIGFQDDTAGNAPLGGGLRATIGKFTADARFNYNFLFDQNFATNVEAATIGGTGADEVNVVGGGSYSTTVNIGGTF